MIFSQREVLGSRSSTRSKDDVRFGENLEDRFGETGRSKTAVAGVDAPEEADELEAYSLSRDGTERWRGIKVAMAFGEEREVGE